ncbi:MAG TPA: hypothetical protein VH643_34055, partial [Gemmataceae bacterium]
KPPRRQGRHEPRERVPRKKVASFLAVRFYSSLSVLGVLGVLAVYFFSASQGFRGRPIQFALLPRRMIRRKLFASNLEWRKDESIPSSFLLQKWRHLS